MQCPSLQRLCLELLAWSQEPYWQLQKRRMQLLPEDAANTLVQLLLQLRRLQQPIQLEAFRHCLTVLHISPSSGIQLDAEWLAYICTTLRQLHSLALTDMSRLKDKALTPLPALATQLQHLNLAGCRGVTNKSLPLLGQLTNLQDLVLTGTSLKSPVLPELTALQRLTRLHLGGCGITDADITQHIAAFSVLQDLNLEGAAAGDAAAAHIAHSLLGLQCLSMAWSQVSSCLPLLSSLQQLDLSNCKLRGPVRDADFVAAADMRQLQVLVLAQAEVDAAVCELLEEMLIACAPSLRVLDLTDATLDNQLALLLALDSATQLSALSLSSTTLPGSPDELNYLAALVECTSLHTLNLSHNNDITAAGAADTLPNIAANLQRLDLGYTGVDNTLLPVLRQLPQLQQLILSGTAVTFDSKPPLSVQQAAQAAQAAAAGAASGVSEGQASSSATGWRSLRLLDVSNTHLTEAGCLQLAAELEAAASSSGAAEASGASSSMQQQPTGASTAAAPTDGAVDGAGLRVLLVGSTTSKLGRKALAGIGRITTLQHLTLQGWSLVDRDLQHLESLQDLQALHIQAADPWLLSDEALLQLTEELPQLNSITRDGRQLLVSSSLDLVLGSAAGGGGVAGSGSSVDSSGSGGSSFSQHSIWPAASLLQEVHSTSAFTVLWLAQRMQRRSVPAGSSSSKQRGHQRAPAAAPDASHTAFKQLGSWAAGGGRGIVKFGRGSTTVYRRLSAFDERYKYTCEELLALRVGSRSQASSDGGSEGALQLQPELPAEIRADAGW